MTTPDDLSGVLVPAALIPVARVLLDDQPTSSVIDWLLALQNRTAAEQEQAVAEWAAEKARRTAEAQARHAAARARVDGKLAAVLDHHGPQMPEHGALWPVCLGCDIDGYDAEQPEWPCSTWTLIAEEDA